MRTCGRAIYFTELEVSKKAASRLSQGRCVPPSKRCLKHLPFAGGDQPRSQKLLQRDILTRGRNQIPAIKMQRQAPGREGHPSVAKGVFPSPADPWDSPGAHGFASDSWVTTAARHPARLQFPSHSNVRFTATAPLPRLEPNIPCGLFQPIDLFSEA